MADKVIENPDSKELPLGRTALRLQILSTVISTIALSVAIIALVNAVRYARQPVPADPTAVPSYGTPREQVTIHDAAGGRELMAFIEKNAGRKVRIYAQIDAADYEKYGNVSPPTETSLILPDVDCPSGSIKDLTTNPCSLLELRIQANESGRIGLVFQHGSYGLTGYFASVGVVGTWMGVTVYTITPMTPIEAVG